MGILQLKKPAAERVVTVFGSSRPAPGDADYLVAADLGREIGRAGFTLCNGGFGGIMAASAQGAKEVGGRTIGVITTAFGSNGANPWIDTIITKSSLVERMMELIALGDAYVILKGGTGTLLEFAAVWEFINKNILPEKPVIVVGSFWDGVLSTLREELAWEGQESCIRHVTVVGSPGECAGILRRRLNKETRS